MRHRRATKKLSRNTSNRKALLKSLVTNLIICERIITTREKAKEASSLADKLITLGKRNTITSKKNAISILGSKSLINRLFGDIAPRFATRAGGYTRVLQLAPRRGDGAKMAVLELTERKVVEKVARKKEKTPPKEISPDLERKKGRKRLPAVAEEAEKKKQAIAKEKPHAPAPPEAAPISTKEKIDEVKGKERAKSEKDKLKKSFFKGLRRYFRGKTP